VGLAVCRAARPGCGQFSKLDGRGLGLAHKGIWFFKNKTCWMVVAVSLAAIESDIECRSSRWTIVGTGDIAVMVKRGALVTC
jgi:hypothetical protein